MNAATGELIAFITRFKADEILYCLYAAITINAKNYPPLPFYDKGG